MEKVIIKSWDDLEGYVICEDAYIVGEKHKRRSYGGCVFKVNSLESCVNIMNVLGGNFEYKEIEVIDTLEKWEEFQEKICRFFYIYDRVFKVFVELGTCNADDEFSEIVDGSVSIEEIERKFDVDLKIFNED